MESTIILSVAEYRATIAALPRPRQEQIESYVEFVSNAHSWYKHLPMYPPGRSFYFYLDPSAGMHRTVGVDGRLRCVASETRGFHYSTLATAEHLRRFGHLAYCRAPGDSVELHLANGTRMVPADEDARVFDISTDSWRRVPDEVLQSGRTRVSGLVHPIAMDYASMLLWHQAEREPWPAESGGEAAYAAIVARLNELRQDPRKVRSLPPEHARVQDRTFLFPEQIDLILFELIEPEWLRQKRGMVHAMQRVIARFHSPPN